jgi:hypothetical protein
MHPLKHPRNAVFIGLVFAVIGLVYWAIPYFFGFHLDYAGTTMLVVLGVAMAIMFYTLIAGSPSD